MPTELAYLLIAEHTTAITTVNAMAVIVWKAVLRKEVKVTILTIRKEPGMKNATTERIAVLAVPRSDTTWKTMLRIPRAVIRESTLSMIGLTSARAGTLTLVERMAKELEIVTSVAFLNSGIQLVNVRGKLVVEDTNCFQKRSRKCSGRESWCWNLRWCSSRCILWSYASYTSPQYLWHP